MSAAGRRRASCGRVDAGEQRRGRAEARQGRVAAADVGAVLEHVRGSRARGRASASAVPGSVMATKLGVATGDTPRTTRAGCGSRSSSPTSTAATNSVRSRSSSAATRGSAAGSVVSSTRELRDGRAAAERAGQHLGEQARAAHAHAARRARAVGHVAGRSDSASEVTVSSHLVGRRASQPSRSATSVGSSCQSVWSPAADACRRRPARRASAAIASASPASGPSRSTRCGGSISRLRTHSPSGVAAAAAATRPRR